MADSADIETALREIVQAVRDTSFVGVPVVRGWPSDDDLTAIEGNAGSIVAVMQRPGNFARNTSRYLDAEFPTIADVPPSITATISGNVATFAGTGSTDQIAGVKAASGEWSVRCVAAETASAVAGRLAVLSGGTAVGPALTVTGLVTANTMRDAPFATLTRQQAMQFSVVIWTADPVKRDQIAAAIDANMATLSRLTLTDGSPSQIKWAGSVSTDKARDEGLYRRDLSYLVDYSTMNAFVYPRVLFPDLGFAGTAVPAAGDPTQERF